MSCYSCSAEFGILKKEIGCEICGFAFCSRCCIKQKIPSESGDVVKKLVCSNCYKKITSNETSAKSSSPPLAHKRRMEALKKQSYSVDSATHAYLQSQWTNEKDKALAERLQKLKRDRIKDELPSEEEIQERLAKLKGMDPLVYKAPPIQVFRPSEKRTSIEQANDLMKQFTEEVQLDSKRVKPEDEIAARLAKLRDEQPSKKVEPFNIPHIPSNTESEDMDIESAYSALQKDSAELSNTASEEVKKLNTDVEYKKLLLSMQQEKEVDEEITEEEEADRLVEKLMASNIDEGMEDLDSLNDQDAEKPSSKSSQDASTEEFPWCVICTEDAKIRCFGCDEDLYCMRCFKECHDSLDIKDHRTCPFLPPKAPGV